MLSLEHAVNPAGIGCASGTADCSATSWWLGFSEVLDPDEDPVDDLTAVGSGGVDRVYPVPEPTPWLLPAAGLGCLVALCQVRGRPSRRARIASDEATFSCGRTARRGASYISEQPCISQ